jgi:hypothetical protein
MLVDLSQSTECCSIKDGAYVPLWYLWREMNDRGFEDRKRMMEDIVYVDSCLCFSFINQF